MRGGFPVFAKSPHRKKGGMFTILPVGRLKTGDASVRVGGCLNGVLKVGTAPGRFSENPPGFE